MNFYNWFLSFLIKDVGHSGGRAIVMCSNKQSGRVPAQTTFIHLIASFPSKSDEFSRLILIDFVTDSWVLDDS